MPPRGRRPSFGTEKVLDIPLGAFELHLLRRYAAVALAPPPGRDEFTLGDDLAAWYRANRARLGFKVLPIEALLRKKSTQRPTDDLEECLARFGDNTLRFTRSTRPVYDAPAPAPSALQKRLDFIARTLKLEALEAAALGAVARLSMVAPFRALYAAAKGGEPDVSDEVDARVAVRLAGIDPRRLVRIDSLDSPLIQLGLLEDRGGGDVAVSRTVADILRRPTTDARALQAGLFGEATPSSLTLDDFAHLPGRERLVAILYGALRRRERGAGVLFYGPPGTGKTEFARLLGATLGAQVVAIGERNEERGDSRREPSRFDRLAHLAFASALADRAGRVLLVVDEADDVFAGVDGASERVGSKVFVNRVVEACPVPTVWITNSPHMLGPAVLRRMLTAVEFREPDATVRGRIVRRHAAEMGLTLGDDAVRQLALLPASPAILRAGLKAADLAGGRGGDPAATALAVVHSLAKVAGRTGAVPPPAGPIAFDAALSNADTDLAGLEARIVAAGPGALSFLFAGLPGTGKSAFARHLAARLGLPVLEKRGSDLLGKYVGETERRIADAFEEAVEAGAFLVFDEADGLIGDRAGARHGWEISQVNEMLTQLERHPLPFATTTNFAARLDPALHRRVLFKVRFAAMTPAQAGAAFARIFGHPAPAAVGRLDPLTPGDFALVARKADVLGETSPEALAAMLAAEVAAKPGAARRIGF